MDSCLIDPFAFCKNGERLGGRASVSGLERLAAVCANQSGELAWEVSGSLDNRQRSRLLIHVFGDVALVCQRCLEMLVSKLDSETVVMVARTEEDVTDGKVDIRDLVEDEALLALPLSPRHEVCPDTATGKWRETRESPFSALKTLKTKG